jgi:hypothetical protein
MFEPRLLGLALWTPPARPPRSDWFWILLARPDTLDTPLLGPTLWTLPGTQPAQPDALDLPFSALQFRPRLLSMTLWIPPARPCALDPACSA